MAKISVTSTGQVPARATEIYALLLDYRNEHALLLPQDFFHDMSVVSGGHGAGTIFTYWVNVDGARRDVRMRVSEPEAYRTLLEEDHDTDLSMSFTLDQGAQATTVTITTSWTPSAGFKGQMERVLSAARWRKAQRQILGSLKGRVIGFAA